MTSIGQADDRDRSLAAAVPETGDPVPAPLEPAGAAPTRRRFPPRTWVAAFVGVLVLPIAVAAGITFSAGGFGNGTPDAAAARVVSASDLESEYGIKVNLVAVSAGGGMIDLRFTVTDKDKAIHLLHDATVMPELLVEPSGTVIHAPTGMRHKVTILDGGNYFILYPNPGGAIQAGTQVSVVIDRVRLAPLGAQS
jgi:hypothetical protein